MARVDYNPVPTVQASGDASNDLEHIDAGPDAFGAQVAQGIGDIGQGVVKAADFYGEVAATQAVNNVITQATSVLRGDPNKQVQGPDGQMVPDTGFFGLRGQNAMAARQGVAKQISDIIDQNASTLSTPESRMRYESSVRRYQSEYLNQIGSHADQQQQAWASDVNNTTASLAVNDIAANPLDDNAFSAAQERIRHAMVKNAQLNYGSSPDIAQGALLKADQTATQARIDALIVANPQKAKEVFDASHGLLGSMPGYDNLAAKVRTANINATMGPAVEQAVTDGVADATKLVGVPGTGSAPRDFSKISAEQARSIISAGEGPASAGGYNAIVGNIAGGGNKFGIAQQNLTGMTIGQVFDLQRNVLIPATRGKVGQGDLGSSAVGHYQFVSGTLEAQAKAIWGDNWRNQPFSPANQDAMFDHLYNSVKNDPAALAAQWPSLMKGGTNYPSQTDSLLAHEPDVLAKANVTATSLFPDDPQAQQQYVDQVRNRYRQEITVQNQQSTANASIIQSILDSDHPPLSLSDLTSRGPDVAAAWAAFQRNNPAAALHVRNSFNANANGLAGNLGTNFKTYLDRVLSPGDDANRLSNPGQLWEFIGPGDSAPLTNSGAKELAALMEVRGAGPQADANAAAVRKFVDTTHAAMTFSNPVTGIEDPKGEHAFAKYMAGVLPVLTQAQKSGNLTDLLNPQSKNYVGIGMGAFMRDQAATMKDRIEATQRMSHLPPITPQALNQSLDGLDTDQQRKDALRAAVQQRRISATDGAAIAVARGYARDPFAAQHQSEAAIDAAATPSPMKAQ